MSKSVCVKVCQGQHCEKEVPDTLDLAERAEQAINGLTQTLDVAHECEQYFFVCYTADPPYLAHFCIGDLFCTAKYAESLPLMRLMSASQAYLEDEQHLINTLLGLVSDDGCMYVPAVDEKQTPWRVRADYPVAHEPLTVPFGNARLMLALMAYQQTHPEMDYRPLLAKMASGLGKTAIVKEEYAYYPEGKVGMEFSYLQQSGYQYTAEPTAPDEGAEGSSLCYQGGQLRALARWIDMSGDAESLELANKLARFIMKRNFWGADGQSSCVTGADHGHFRRHLHGNAIALRGLLEYGQVVGNLEAKQFVRDAYEYARTWGLGLIGCFGDGYWGPYTEGCSIADMVALGIRLSDWGMGDYWDDVDRYVRNHLVEAQLLRPDVLEQVSKAAAADPQAYQCYPAKNPPGLPWNPTWSHDLMEKTRQKPVTDNVIERSLGLFAAFTGPTAICYPVSNGCCSGNASQALYYAWESIVRAAGRQAQVNLLLNRVSNWLDVESYLPYEGKVVIRCKTVERLAVRIPGWVETAGVKVSVNSQAVQPIWVGRYIVVEGLRHGDVVTINFAMIEYTVRATQVFDKTYTMRFRGHTLVDISPRETNPTAYPIYRRQHYRQGTAPVKKVNCFAATPVVIW